jgi:hypothetical protein
MLVLSKTKEAMLPALEAKDYLCSLRGNEDFDQHEVNKAIKKIEGELSRFDI